MTAAPRQMSLMLEHRPALGRAEFLVSASNADAVRLLSGWRDWPRRHMALTGPARAGKTHLAHVWMHECGAELLPAGLLDDAAAERLVRHGMVVIEDVDALATLEPSRRLAAEKALFHLYNLAAAEGAWLLLTGRAAPDRWPVETPDLASRLAALPIARLDPPDEALLSSLMVKLFADRQLHVAPDVIHYLALRIERSCAAAEAAVEALDHLSLERKKPVTRAMAVELLGADLAGED
ncbi:MAG TPA: DnaA/Hda family protein [Thermohalobaculum sp.]|nr:DnaA/Hda family protein [Thermohalobaculum sp.]